MYQHLFCLISFLAKGDWMKYYQHRNTVTLDIQFLAKSIYQEVKRLAFLHRRAYWSYFREFLLIWCQLDEEGWVDKEHCLRTLNALVTGASLAERQCLDKNCLRELFLLRCELASILFAIRGRQPAMLGGQRPWKN